MTARPAVRLALLTLLAALAVAAFLLVGSPNPSLTLRFRLPTLAARVGMLPMEPASLLMERKMLQGIKRRAEALAREVE